jgi:ketosteroid isomerase-like protein
MDDIWIRPVGVAASDTAAEIRLTGGEHEVGPPEWSPDGTRILFTGSRTESGHHRSYAGMVTIDTTSGRAVRQESIRLGPIPGAEKVAWSPASDDIAIQAIESSGRHAIWIVRADGTRPRRLVQYRSHTYSGVDWSADGRTIIYAAIVDGSMQLFAIPARCGTPRQLTHDTGWNVLHPSVSPDGRLMAATRIRTRTSILRQQLQREPLDIARDRDLRAIDAARRRFEEAIRSNDIAAIANTYAPDAFYFPPGRDPLSGRDAIRRPILRGARDYEIVHVVHEVDIRGDIAYEIGQWVRRNRNGGATTGGGGYLWIWKRQPEGQWAIWREVWNDGPATGAP